MTNVEKIVADSHQMLADFTANRAEIEGRKVHDALWMLIWKFDGSSLFVGRRPKALETGATGFNWAITFRDENHAKAYVQRTKIRNGKNDHPVPIRVADARAEALSNIDGVIATLTAMTKDA